jgi:CheY-like chemotaxis protein
MAKRILLVEDEDLVRDFLAQLLTDAGYEVTEAANGQIAMLKMSEVGADLAIIDMLMPVMEGAETIFALRRFYPNLKIIAVSGGGLSSAEGHLLIARALGSQKILTKPLISTELLEAIRELIGADVSEG